MCVNISLDEAHCKNKKCALDRKLASCLLCGEYLTCKDTEYQRETYPCVIENHRRVEEVGLERHLEEEEEKTRAGVDLMGHLERRFCKVVPLE